ncbi:hypothetical protein [Halorubrum sp. BV1]|uniref:hypothetical protein n=1 Tax=Halorubrum sp. BV1 TaxID=1498500 RepID=UPI0012BAE924|nr:hypothetical protein [Halorubrum sp. BV1]
MDPVTLHHVSEGMVAGLVGLTGIVSFGAGVAYARLKDHGSLSGPSRTTEPVE